MTNAVNLASAAGTGFAFRNRIINGDMRIAQRYGGTSVTSVVSFFGAYSLDRWGSLATAASKYTFQQNAGAVTPPSGFQNYIGITSSSAYSLSVGDYFGIGQRVEGFNFADANWGTANAQSVTLSFWVRSSLTGTFGAAVQNSAQTRSYPFTYTVNAANTWEYKTISILGDTSGTWHTGTGRGFHVRFGLSAGTSLQQVAGSWGTGNVVGSSNQTNIMATSGATFYITGVQLEKGSTATSFDYRPYGTELALCQRYYYRRNYDQTTNDLLATFHAYSSGGAWGKIIDLPVEMRATPTGGLSSIGHFRPTNSTGSNQAAFTAGTLAGQGTSKSQLTTAGWSGSSGLTAGNATVITTNTASAWIDASAEL